MLDKIKIPKIWPPPDTHNVFDRRDKQGLRRRRTNMP